MLDVLHCREDAGDGRCDAVDGRCQCFLVSLQVGEGCDNGSLVALQLGDGYDNGSLVALQLGDGSRGDIGE